LWDLVRSKKNFLRANSACSKVTSTRGGPAGAPGRSDGTVAAAAAAGGAGPSPAPLAEAQAEYWSAKVIPSAVAGAPAPPGHPGRPFKVCTRNSASESGRLRLVNTSWQCHAAAEAEACPSSPGIGMDPQSRSAWGSSRRSRLSIRSFQLVTFRLKLPMSCELQHLEVPEGT
jgi:hypothetical protein